MDEHLRILARMGLMGFAASAAAIAGCLIAARMTGDGDIWTGIREYPWAIEAAARCALVGALGSMLTAAGAQAARTVMIMMRDEETDLELQEVPNRNPQGERTMAHPGTFLTPGKRLETKDWENLAARASDSHEGPETDEISFIFAAREGNERYDRIIQASRTNNTFRCLPQPHCICPRDPLECECNETECSKCGAELTAMTSVCDMEYCVNDECPLCEHQRETCM